MPNNPIDTEKEKALKTIQTKLAGMEGLAYEVFLKSIEDIFDFKAGKFVVEKNFIKQLNKLTVQVLDLLQSEPKFTGPVSQFVKRLTPVSEAITDFQKSTNNIKVPAYETAKKVVIDEIIDKMLDNGLNAEFVQPLRDIVYQNATTGISLKDAKIQIKEFISGGGDKSGKLGSYLEQTAQQGVDAYSGAINKRLLETFDYDALLMTGSLIDNSSPQCRYVVEELGGRILESDWPKVKAIAEKNGLIDGTTFDNLPQNRLHWGCRHSFYPIINKKVA